jgi:hypothetical protein
MRRALGVTLVIAAVLTVCLWRLRPLHVDAADVVGTWNGRDGVSVQVLPDGTLNGIRVPFEIVGGDWTGTGTWQLSPADNYGGPRLDVGLDRERAATDLYVDRHDGAIALFMWLGDPDEGQRYWFTRAG